MADRLRSRRRPTGYRPPKYKDVETLLVTLKEERQARIDRMRELKQARRDQWDSVIAKIPVAFKRALPIHGFPELEDLLQRIVGMIAANEPVIEVVPSSGRPEDVRKAAKEEARLHALFQQIEDQQDRPLWQMGIDAQAGWGESWMSIWPDPSRYRDSDDDEDDENDDGPYKRKDGESAKDYSERYARTMAERGVGICIEDHDPQTIYPLRADKSDDCQVVIIETEHTVLDIHLGMGYKPIKSEEGKTNGWHKAPRFLGQPYVLEDNTAGGVVDIAHDNPNARPIGTAPPGTKCKKVVYIDPWITQTYLDGILVEEWEHESGYVPVFYAAGQQSADRDPAWRSRSIIDGPLVLARQIVLYSAILSSSAMQHGFPTPFLKNAEHGLVNARGEPITRAVNFGELNLLGPNEDIVFPFLQANMAADFGRNLEMLLQRLSDATFEGFGAKVGPDTSGYAVAQMRTMWMSMANSIRTNAARQRRKLAYAARDVIERYYPAGIYLRGAVETKEVEGVEIQYRPVHEYSKDHVTGFAIEVHVEEGIVQDDMARNKMAIEMQQAGIWSKRRAMEETGVEDPEAEMREINVNRILDSPAADQQVMIMAMALAAERFQASRTDESSPFIQAMRQAQQMLLGGQEKPAGAPMGPGQFQNQGAEPQNALPGGQPIQQNPSPQTPLEGGPVQGPRLDELGVPKIPGGVRTAGVM